MGLTKRILKIAAPVPKVESFSRYLFIGPHPDDIEIGSGATAAKLVSEGKQAAFLILTDGRYGDRFSKGVTGDDLAALRKQEALRSAAHLGVTDVRFLDLCDGGFYSYEELIRGIAKVIGECKPELIFAPDPSTGREYHVDHLRAGQAAAHVACLSSHQGIMERYGAAAADVKGVAFYMTARPNRFVKVSPEQFRMQRDAVFRYHVSQYPDGSGDAKQLTTYLKLRSAEFGLRTLCKHAEGFLVLGKTHMHCLPEMI